jgi:hypothetical protein
VKGPLGFQHYRDFKGGDPGMNIQIETGVRCFVIIGIHEGPNVANLLVISKKMELYINTERR